MSDKLVIGIDPGNSGGLAIIYGRSAKVLDMPTLQDGKKTLINGHSINEIIIVETDYMTPTEAHVFVELAQVMPKQGIVSAGRYMKGAGIIEGILISIGVPYTLVSPRTWRKTIMKGMPKGKQSSIIRAQQLYPSVDLHPTGKSGRKLKASDGRAEALLIAHYGLGELSD